MKVNASDLINANSSENLTNLKNVSIYSKKVTESINNFISESKNILQGSDFDAALQNLESVTNELQTFYQKGMNLNDNINSANNKFSNFVSPDAYLDNGKLEDLRKQRDNINYAIDNVYNSMYVKLNGVYVARYSSWYVHQLRQYESELAEVNRLIDKLSHLKDNDDAATDILG